MEEHQEKELRKKREEEEKKKLQEQKRALVDRYRQEKLSEEMAMKTAEETERLQAKQESMQQAATLLKYFRYEDRRFTDRLKARKQLKEREKEEPRVKSCVEVRRDPNRLLQPTLGWLYHTRKCEDSDSSTISAPQLHIQHLRKLGKPAWRKGLTS
ncbi:coiled-coil domain-containing protein 112-like [Homalodisca vitripennis]|nr:coiled-coil domain-containing protein 112-like [Homalodisca vitripennis]